MRSKSDFKRKSSSRSFKTVAVTLSIICILFSYFFSKIGSGSDVHNSGRNFDEDIVRVLDVGQGDCTLIYSNGYSALIDTGTADSANDICAVLSEYGIDDIDVMLITHLHTDHTGGVPHISELFGIKNVVLPEISIESDGLGAAEYLINKITAVGGEVYNAKPGMNFSIGKFEITVLASFGNMSDENNRSVMASAKIGDFKFMFTGDAEAKAEKALLDENLDLKCDVFMAGHHGSSTSNTDALLDKMRPNYVAVSAGAGNMYGHPHKEALAAFERVGARVFRTDSDGDIMFYINDGKLTVKTEKTAG